MLHLGLRATFCRSGLRFAISVCAVTLLAVWVLSICMALPAALGAADRRSTARYPAEGSTPAETPLAGPPLLVAQRTTISRGHRIQIVEVANGESAVPPPGLAHLPGSSESVVSPALASMLDNDEIRAELAGRIPTVIDRIAASGLRTDGELIAYVGADAPALAARRDSFEITAWGLRGVVLHEGDPISPFVVLPLLLLVAFPLYGSYRAAVSADRPRRQRRQEILTLLGASRWDRRRVEMVIVGLPLVVGILGARLTSRWFTGVLVEQGLRGRFFVSSDLHLDIRHFAVLIAALLVVASVAMVQSTGAVRRARAMRSWLVSVGAPIATLGGLVGAVVTANSRQGGSHAQATWLLLFAVIFVVGVWSCLDVVTRVVARLLGGLGLCAEVASRRLAGGPPQRRTIAAPAAGAAALLGLALAIFAVLDAASQTDSLLWAPTKVADDTVFVSARGDDAEAVIAAGADSLVVLPDENLLDLDGQPVASPVALVGCTGLSSVFGGGVTDCNSAYVRPGRMSSGADRVRLNDPSGHLRTESMAFQIGEPVIPADLVGGTESILVPVADADLISYLSADAGRTAYVTALANVADQAQLEALRDATWTIDRLEIAGSRGSLGGVVAKADLVNDGRMFRNEFGRLTLTLLSLGLMMSLCAAVLSGLAELVESEASSAALASIAMKPGAIVMTTTIALLAPWTASMFMGALSGLALGVIYLRYADYASLSGFFGGFPMAEFASWTAIWFAVLAGAACVSIVASSRWALRGLRSPGRSSSRAR